MGTLQEGPGAAKGRPRSAKGSPKRRRQRAREAGKSGDEVRGSCALAAPTGSASFQMKFGASTAHRTFGINPFQPFAQLAENGPTYKRLRDRLKLARLLLVDERSMIGRMFLGKIAHRLEEVLGSGDGPRGATLGGRDLLLVGDDKQIRPIGDDPLFVDGRS